ncbi:MAG: hypothetical protein M1813_000083 [Trichoglossum hirsutum]|nr:MAG: hypothetical protein M1813_000083 [Trichoglossum hirsutum]
MESDLGLDFEHYTVAWIAPLEIEAQAAWYMLDHEHRGSFSVNRGDDYVYTAGDINGHNVIIATFPAGHNYGVGSAAALASQVKRSFPNLWFGLLVGVAAGLPNLSRIPPRDIRLGDVLVGVGEGESAGLVNYGLGKETSDGFELLPSGAQTPTETVVRSAIGSIKSLAPMHGNVFLQHYEGIKNKPHSNGTFADPGQERDQLYQTAYEEDNLMIKLVERTLRSPSERTKVWYGPIGSGDKLMKNARKRDDLREKFNLIGLEMEAAGAMNTIPVGVIRGVCDYGDAQKNKEWQPYAAAMAAAYAKELLCKIRPAKNRRVEALREQEALATITSEAKACFFMPFDRDTQFIGREDIIANIDRKLKIGRRVALAGIGGVGKSQIAIEYCYRFKAKNPSGNIFWVHASTATRFGQAYNDVARKLSLPGVKDPKANILQLVYEWLSDEDNGTWLMILDNADDIETFFGARPHGSLLGAEQTPSLFGYLPRSSKGSIIVTTRDARIGERLADREKPIMVVPPVIQEAECLLRSKLPPDHEWREVETAELLNALGYLPLAITQAAAFISENSLTLAEYIETLQASDSDMTDLLSENLHDPRRDRDTQSSVVRTWKLSFDQIRKQKPRAAQILSLMAVLDRHGVPKSLLRREDEKRIEFTTALGTLQAFSLIVAEKGGEALVMHRLVQLSTLNWLKSQNRTEVCQEEALELLSEKFPNGEHNNWKICGTLSPHAQVVLEYRYTSNSGLLHRATLLHNVAWYDWQQGRYEIAYKSCMEAYDIRQSILNENNPEILDSLGLLALVLQYQGKYSAAEEMGRRALGGREKVLGKEHPGTLTSVSDLVSVLQYQGKYKAAEEMNRRALGGREKVLGKEHPSTLMSMSKRASLLQNQGKYEAAEEMNRRVLGGNEKVLGNEHPDTLTSMSNLALVLQNQGKYEAAEEMTQRALCRRKKVLGKDHPDTLTSVSDLASVLQDQGKYGAAEEMNRRALGGYEKTLGKEHPGTLISMRNLASVLHHQGKYEAAEEMNRRALSGYEKVLGKEHPGTLTSVRNLASVLQNQGKYGAAEEMDRRALGGYEKTLGEEHPITLSGVGNLASVLHHQGKYGAAEEMNRRALSGYEKVLGKEHPDTLTSVRNLASVLQDQGKYGAAEEMNRRALGGYEKMLGKEHPITLSGVSNLALVLQNQDKYEAAEEMNRRVLVGREKVLGKEHPGTLLSVNNLALVLQNQGKYGAAEEMNRRALSGREKALGREHPDTLTSVSDLALVLQHQGKYEAAEEMNRRALGGYEKVLGKEHPYTLMSVYCLAYLLHKKGEYDDASAIYQRACTGFEKVLGLGHPETVACSGNYLSLLEEMKSQNRDRC